MINDIEIEELDDAIDAAMDALLPRQRLFVVELVNGRTETATDAIRRIGCKDTREPKQAAWRMQQSSKVAHAIKLLRHRQELHEGVYIGRKRQHLLDIIDNTKTTKPAVAVTAIKTLNEMDGDNAATKVQLGGHVAVSHVTMVLDSGRPPIDVTPAESDLECDHIEFQPDDDFLI